MADMLGNALSALVSYQRALATTSHNIANSDTEGYSRQRVSFTTRIPQQMGELSIGSGVTVSSISRAYDSFATSQLRTVNAAYSQLDTYYQFAAQLDNTLSDSDFGVSAALSNFYDSIQTVADDPGSISARRLFLAEAQSLSDRFAGMSNYLDDMQQQANTQIQSTVSEINSLTQRIADVNNLIVESQGQFGGAPSDLLDDRDQALLELNRLVSVSSVEQNDGSMSVFIGNGQALVLGNQAVSVSTVRSPLDASRLEIALDIGGQSSVITQSIRGGHLGGILSFRDGLLTETENELGRIALALSASVNEQNQAGIDLYGDRGQAVFNTPEPSVVNSAANTGSATVSATFDDIGNVTGDNLILRYNGSTWELSQTPGNTAVSPDSGSGSVADPFIIDGVALSISGTPAAGDEFLIRPSAEAAGTLKVEMTDPARVAAAAATRSEARPANTGTGQISQTEIIDSNHANLTDPVDITFLDATTYQINGSGSFSYTPGEAIDINGNRVVITGTPDAGDQFSILDNAGASGDNRNALALASTEANKLLSGGTVSVQEATGALVGRIGVATHSADISRQSQANLLAQAEARQQSVSGVNLDEEAANLLKYQQAYQAAAQATAVAKELFQTLMAAF